MTESFLKPASRLKSIDFLRGIAALGVVVCHSLPPRESDVYSSAWFAFLGSVLGHGTLGVPLFFVISGFCIHLRWAKNYVELSKQRLDFVQFWKRRFHRLYPPYFVMLCISMSLMGGAYAIGLASLDLYPEPKSRWLAIDFFAHAFMLHGLHPVLDEGGGNPPMWTLAREEYFYIMYFGLLSWRRTRGLVVASVSVLVLGLLFPFLMRPFLAEGSSWWHIVNTSAIVLWFQWCLGMVAVECYCGITKLPKWCSSGCMIPLWFVLGRLSTFYCHSLTPVLWGMTFFTIVNYCVKIEQAGKWPQTFHLHWLAGVGVFSYSLYLVHNPVINLTRHLIKPLAGNVTSVANPWLIVLIMLVQILVSYFVGKLFFSLVESHFLNEKPKHLDVKLSVRPSSATALLSEETGRS